MGSSITSPIRSPEYTVGDDTLSYDFKGAYSGLCSQTNHFR